MPRKEKQVWFCSRESGMLFYPVAWQGYVVLVVFTLLMAVSSLAIAKSLLLFFGIEFGLVVVLMIVVSSTSDF